MSQSTKKHNLRHHPFFKRRNNRYLSILYLSCIVSVFYFILVARYLRPIADDYCTGMFVFKKGIIATIFYWYHDWSGYLFANLVNAVVVGAPLAYLDFSNASWISVLMTVFAIGFTAASVLRYYCILTPFPTALGVTGSVWILHLAVGQLRQNDLHSTFLHWQTINAQYIIVECILINIILYSLFLIGESTQRKFIFVMPAFAGLLAGLSSIQYSVMLLYLFVSLGVFTSEFISGFYRRFGLMFSTVVGVTVGFLISNLSPGNAVRYSVAHYSGSRVLSRLSEYAIHKGLYAYIDFLFKAPMIVTFAFIFVWIYLFELHSSNPILPNVKRLFLFAVSFVSGGAVLAIITGCIESITYYGHWHLTSSYVMGWFGVLAASALSAIYCAKRFKKMHLIVPESFSNILLFCFAVILFILVSASMHKLSSNLSSRYSKWMQGESPIAGATDATWAKSCYINLVNYRHLPDHRYD